MNRPCYYQAFIIGSFLLPAPNGRCPHCSLEHHRPFHKMCLLCNFSPSSPIDRPSTIQLNLFSVAAFGALHPDKNEMTPEKRLEDFPSHCGSTHLSGVGPYSALVSIIMMMLYLTLIGQGNKGSMKMH